MAVPADKSREDLSKTRKKCKISRKGQKVIKKKKSGRFEEATRTKTSKQESSHTQNKQRKINLPRNNGTSLSTNISKSKEIIAPNGESGNPNSISDSIETQINHKPENQLYEVTSWNKTTDKTWVYGEDWSNNSRESIEYCASEQEELERGTNMYLKGNLETTSHNVHIDTKQECVKKGMKRACSKKSTMRSKDDDNSVENEKNDKNINKFENEMVRNESVSRTELAMKNDMESKNKDEGDGEMTRNKSASKSEKRKPTNTKHTENNLHKKPHARNNEKENNLNKSESSVMKVTVLRKSCNVETISNSMKEKVYDKKLAAETSHIAECDKSSISNEEYPDDESKFKIAANEVKYIKKEMIRVAEKHQEILDTETANTDEILQTQNSNQNSCDVKAENEQMLANTDQAEINKLLIINNMFKKMMKEVRDITLNESSRSLPPMPTMSDCDFSLSWNPLQPPPPPPPPPSSAVELNDSTQEEINEIEYRPPVTKKQRLSLTNALPTSPQSTSPSLCQRSEGNLQEIEADDACKRVRLLLPDATCVRPQDSPPPLFASSSIQVPKASHRRSRSRTKNQKPFPRSEKKEIKCSSEYVPYKQSEEGRKKSRTSSKQRGLADESKNKLLSLPHSESLPQSPVGSKSRSQLCNQKVPRINKQKAPRMRSQSTLNTQPSRSKEVCSKSMDTSNKECDPNEFPLKSAQSPKPHESKSSSVSLSKSQNETVSHSPAEKENDGSSLKKSLPLSHVTKRPRTKSKPQLNSKSNLFQKTQLKTSSSTESNLCSGSSINHQSKDNSENKMQSNSEAASSSNGRSSTSQSRSRSRTRKLSVKKSEPRAESLSPTTTKLQMQSENRRENDNCISPQNKERIIPIVLKNKPQLILEPETTLQKLLYTQVQSESMESDNNRAKESYTISQKGLQNRSLKKPQSTQQSRSSEVVQQTVSELSLECDPWSLSHKVQYRAVRNRSGSRSESTSATKKISNSKTLPLPKPKSSNDASQEDKSLSNAMSHKSSREIENKNVSSGQPRKFSNSDKPDIHTQNILVYSTDTSERQVAKVTSPISINSNSQSSNLLQRSPDSRPHTANPPPKFRKTKENHVPSGRSRNRWNSDKQGVQAPNILLYSTDTSEPQVPQALPPLSIDPRSQTSTLLLLSPISRPHTPYYPPSTSNDHRSPESQSGSPEFSSLSIYVPRASSQHGVPGNEMLGNEFGTDYSHSPFLSCSPSCTSYEELHSHFQEEDEPDGDSPPYTPDYVLHRTPPCILKKPESTATESTPKVSNEYEPPQDSFEPESLKWRERVVSARQKRHGPYFTLLPFAPGSRLARAGPEVSPSRALLPHGPPLPGPFTACCTGPCSMGPARRRRWGHSSHSGAFVGGMSAFGGSCCGTGNQDNIGFVPHGGGYPETWALYMTTAGDATALWPTGPITSSDVPDVGFPPAGGGCSCGGEEKKPEKPGLQVIVSGHALSSLSNDVPMEASAAEVPAGGAGRQWEPSHAVEVPTVAPRSETPHEPPAAPHREAWVWRTLRTIDSWISPRPRSIRPEVSRRMQSAPVIRRLSPYQSQRQDRPWSLRSNGRWWQRIKSAIRCVKNKTRTRGSRE